MTTRRITDFAELQGAAIVDADIFPAIQVNEVDVSLKNKKVTFSGLRVYLDKYYTNLAETSDVSFTGNVFISSTLTVSSNTTIGGSAAVGGTFDVTGSLTGTSASFTTVNTSSTATTASLITNSVIIVGAGSLLGSLGITGNATISNDVTAGGNLTVTDTKPNDIAVNYPAITAFDLGTKPNQIAQNWMLGRMAYQDLGLAIDALSFNIESEYTSGALGYTSSTNAQPAQTVANSTKTLKTFEEGTFNLYAVNPAGTVVKPSEFAEGRYTRIGNSVTLYARFNLSTANYNTISSGVTTSPIRLFGIPFPIADIGDVKFEAITTADNMPAASTYNDVTVVAWNGSNNSFYSDKDVTLSIFGKKTSATANAILNFEDISGATLNFQLTYLTNIS